MPSRLYSAKRQIVRKLLREVREQADLTQVELASKLRRNQSYVSDYERGHRRLDWVAIDDILAACRQDIVDFAARYKRAVISGTS